jgi:hypothetical protein
MSALIGPGKNGEGPRAGRPRRRTTENVSSAAEGTRHVRRSVSDAVSAGASGVRVRAIPRRTISVPPDSTRSSTRTRHRIAWTSLPSYKPKRRAYKRRPQHSPQPPRSHPDHRGGATPQHQVGRVHLLQRHPRLSPSLGLVVGVDRKTIQLPRGGWTRLESSLSQGRRAPGQGGAPPRA